MSTTLSSPAVRAAPQPLPENIHSVQPGGGVCYRMEAAWGRWRRWRLKRFRARYVRRMADRRRGSAAGAPHEILDPRDLKLCRNLCACDWEPAENPFRWREKIPLASWGWAELLILGLPLLAATVLVGIYFWPLAWIPAVVLGWLVSFFRDPPRTIPDRPDALVSPADGKVVDITPMEENEFISGPAVRIGIFLSIFNVHINRAPVESRVIGLRYHPGKFHNAMLPVSAVENENMWIALEEERPPHRRLIVRQISGKIARRIVCGLRPGEVVGRGEKFGMIKFGSRTELILPAAEDLQILVGVGQKVHAGSTLLARWNPPPNP
ncbi:MAG: phosphatidylserine decarboxylase family protein [Pirellulales bacterium]|nr:phosphatidylserine decarboxylase family protein [Pirellulales bacterium]